MQKIQPRLETTKAHSHQKNKPSYDTLQSTATGPLHLDIDKETLKKYGGEPESSR